MVVYTYLSNTTGNHGQCVFQLTCFSRQIWQRFGAPDPPTLNTVGTKTLNTQHTRLRVGLTTLNAHLFQFQLTPSPSCSCGHKFEDTAPLHTPVSQIHNPQIKPP